MFDQILNNKCIARNMDCVKCDLYLGDPPFESGLDQEIIPTTRTFLSFQEHAKQSLQNSKEYYFPVLQNSPQSINQSINQSSNV